VKLQPPLSSEEESSSSDEEYEGEDSSKKPLPKAKPKPTAKKSKTPTRKIRTPPEDKSGVGRRTRSEKQKRREKKALKTEGKPVVIDISQVFLLKNTQEYHNSFVFVQDGGGVESDGMEFQHEEFADGGVESDKEVQKKKKRKNKKNDKKKVKVKKDDKKKEKKGGRKKGKKEEKKKSRKKKFDEVEYESLVSFKDRFGGTAPVNDGSLFVFRLCVVFFFTGVVELLSFWLCFFQNNRGCMCMK